MTTEELDDLIEQKRQELKDLLFTKFALGTMGAMMQPSPPRLVAMPAELENLPEPKPRSSRRAAIAERVAARNGGEPAPTRRRGRRPAEFKLEVLAEHDRGASLAELSAKHGIKEATLAKWAEGRASGALKVTSFVEDGVIDTPPEEPSPEVASEDVDLVDAMSASEGPSQPFPFE